MKRNEVIGQEEVWQRLTEMVREERLPHAIMLCGPQGCGKMALALAFASYLLCQNRDEHNEACGECKQCKMLEKWGHPDLLFSYPTIKTPAMGSEHKPVSEDFAEEWRNMISRSPYFNIEQWMTEIGAENQQAIITAGESDELNRKLSLKSSQGGYKVSVIWLPERMNIECANKILKLIEEPPSHTVFIMVSENPDNLLETIRSRVQRIDVKKTDNESIQKALVSKYGITDDDAMRVARLANGDWLTAVGELTADSENKDFLADFQSLMRLAYQRNVRELKRWSDNINSYGREKQKRFLTYFLRLIRESFMYNFQQPDLSYLTSQEEAFTANFARFVNENNILQINELANKAIRDISQNANGKIVFFDMALQMIVLLIQKK
ncbi:MAG: DNA polymerase III subunit delta [Prevotella sp.]|nr:DNA polymerase III subunit delta [Prevotella sp.]